MKWVEVKPGCELPPIGKFVLLQLKPLHFGHFNPIVVGYLLVTEIHGEPVFYSQGIVVANRGRGAHGFCRVTHWCDCLDTEFGAPSLCKPRCKDNVGRREYET